MKPEFRAEKLGGGYYRLSVSRVPPGWKPFVFIGETRYVFDTEDQSITVKGLPPSRFFLRPKDVEQA